MMKVQEYLQSGKSFDDLKTEFGIKVREYPEDNLVLLDYDQIESPKSHPITIECRSLILNYYGEVVSRSFDRFFNAGECPDFYQDFEFERSVIFEKADGSLIKVYYNPHTDRWEISTRGMAKAEGEHQFGGTFRSKVLEAFGFKDEEAFQEYFRTEYHEYTFIYEFCSPENRIVTRYPEAHMVLLGVRSNKCGRFLSLEAMKTQQYIQGTAHSLNVRMPKVYKANTLADLLEAAKELPNLEEGYVVWDVNSGKRMKIKSPTYVIAHKMRGETGLTPKNILSLLLEGDEEEYLAYFEEDRKHFEDPKQYITDLENQMQTVWETVKDIEGQKDFALRVAHLPFSGVLFQARKLNNQCPVKTFHGMDLNKKLKLCGV